MLSKLLRNIIVCFIIMTLLIVTVVSCAPKSKETFDVRA